MLTHDRLIRLCRARDLLRDVGTEELSINQVADAAAMSRFHFIRQFTAVFGETPGRFRTAARLDRAPVSAFATRVSTGRKGLECS